MGKTGAAVKSGIGWVIGVILLGGLILALYAYFGDIGGLVDWFVDAWNNVGNIIKDSGVLDGVLDQASGR